MDYKITEQGIREAAKAIMVNLGAHECSDKCEQCLAESIEIIASHCKVETPPESND